MKSGFAKFSQFAVAILLVALYQFTGRDELTLVLAHEMGHALGLEHVDNPESVMHQMMGGQAKVELSLSGEDQKGLRDRCGL